VPTTCAAQGVTSGTIADGCGGTLFCGDAVLPRAATGTSTSCALESDGTAKCWGLNSSGQCGDGTLTSPRSTPVVVSGLTGAVTIAAGGNFFCVVQAAGTVRCWGLGTSGQLGNGASLTSSTSVQVSGITNAVSIAAGNNHACARLADGTARCWGLGTSGQLGNNGAATSNVPVTVAGTAGIAGITAGNNHGCVLLGNGEAQCWGPNTSGQLGNGNTAANYPTAVATLASALELRGDITTDTTCAVLSGGALRCWGINGSGQIGDGTTTTHNTPVAVSGISTATHLAMGGAHTCALLSDGTARCWGLGTNGQLGNGGTASSSTQVTVTGLSGASWIAAGATHTCALLSAGGAKCWGLNSSGQVGDATTTQRTSPTTVVSYP
jgi:alpha-tubulin suppressor-like RCC1 family protein